MNITTPFGMSRGVMAMLAAMAAEFIFTGIKAFLFN